MPKQTIIRCIDIGMGNVYHAIDRLDTDILKAVCIIHKYVIEYDE